MPISAKTDQFAIVQDLLKRQDEALEQLDDLDKRVEKAIEEVNSFRIHDSDQIEADSEAEQQSKAA